MLRFFNRLTLGAGNREGNISIENLAEEINQALPVEQDEFLGAGQQNPEVVINDSDLENSQVNHYISESDSETEIDESDSDLRDNLLVIRHHRKNNYTVYSFYLTRYLSFVLGVLDFQ